jgi:hypothetical protein
LYKQRLSEASHSFVQPELIPCKSLILKEDIEASGRLSILLKMTYPAISRTQEGTQDTIRPLLFPSSTLLFFFFFKNNFLYTLLFQDHRHRTVLKIFKTWKDLAQVQPLPIINYMAVSTLISSDSVSSVNWAY